MKLDGSESETITGVFNSVFIYDESVKSFWAFIKLISSMLYFTILPPPLSGDDFIFIF